VYDAIYAELSKTLRVDNVEIKEFFFKLMSTLSGEAYEGPTGDFHLDGKSQEDIPLNFWIAMKDVMHVMGRPLAF
jgi:hypothetical protein